MLLILHISFTFPASVEKPPRTLICATKVFYFFSLLISNDGILFSVNLSTLPVLLLWTWFFFLPPASSYEYNFNMIILAVLFLLQSVSLYGLVHIFCVKAMHSSYIFAFPKIWQVLHAMGFLAPCYKVMRECMEEALYSGGSFNFLFM